MSIVSQLLEGIKIPRMVRAHQVFECQKIEPDKIAEEVRSKLSQKDMGGTIRPGMRVAITAGSRGIANISLIIKSVVDFVKENEGEPFIVPAMGSHGGATAEGQKEVLETFGITEESMGCPIVSSMETVHIGDAEDGKPVFIDKKAHEADGIVVVGRVKPHTCFRGKYESGIMKMMVIGLGKQYGAEKYHQLGFKYLAEIVEVIGNAIIKHANILFSVAILENAYDETSAIVPMYPDEIKDMEPDLLVKAKADMPKILFDETDVLVVDKIGKNISGEGMDSNITGTFCNPYASGGIKSQRVIILDLTDETQGCAVGVGLADGITKRLFEKFDFEMTYPNCITAATPNTGKIPMVMKNDREAIAFGISTCTGIDLTDVRIIRISDSLHVSEIMFSENMLDRARTIPDLEILGEPFDLPFDNNGDLW